MRASREEQVGGAGVSEVSAAFERLGWGVVENSRHDLGTDLFVMARDERLYDLGLLVGVQVKSGETGRKGGGKYFREAVRDSEGNLKGWWFRDKDRKHVDAWLSHGLPHLIVLHDLSTSISYWQHVTADVVVPAGKADAKVLVPKENTIDDRHRNTLLRIAASTRSGITWEHSAWSGAPTLVPRDALRYALLVPRLVAPHPNAGYGTPITPEQAVALLVQSRLFDLSQFAELHQQVPSLEEMAASGDWLWVFASALAHRVISGETDRLLEAIDNAPNPATRTAATVVGAASLVEDGHLDDAITRLDAQLARDESEPVDYAWLVLQHARACAEVGRLTEARAKAVDAQKIVVTHASDVTATAIAGAAAELIFTTSTWGQRDIRDVVAGSDTAAAWWRVQTMSEALTGFVDRSYKDWARNPGVVEIFGGVDVVNNQLLAASLTANYAGDHGDWRRLSALLGRDMLVRLNRHAEPADATSALEVLRLAGDEDGIKRAVQHLTVDGPVTAIAAAAAKVRLEAATRTTGPADLALLQYGGDVLSEETADQTVDWLLTTLDDPSAFVSRTTPSFLLHLRLVDVLAAVVPATSATTMTKVVNRVADLSGQQDQAMATSWARVVDSLPERAWMQDAALRAFATIGDHHDALRLRLLRAISPFSKSAKEQLEAAASTGSMAALGELGDVRNLAPGIVTAAVASLCAEIEQTVVTAKAGRFNFGSDAGRSLALLNVWHPTLAAWDPLLNLLGEDAAPGGYKIGAFQVLAALVDHLPDGIKGRLGAIAADVASKPPRTDLPLPIGGDPAGAAANLAVALGAFDALSTAKAILTLLAGDQPQQSWAARTAKNLGTAEGVGILAALAESDDAYVRATASANLASLVTAADNVDAFAIASLHRSISDPGTLVPSTIAQTIVGSPTRSAHALELLGAMKGHRSARVRGIVAKVIDS